MDFPSAMDAGALTVDGRYGDERLSVLLRSQVERRIVE